MTTADEYRKMLTHAYSVVPEDKGLATFRSDEFTMDASLSKEDISSYKDIWVWNDISPDDATAAFNWRRYYQTIYEANYLLESRDKIENGTESEVNQMIGESYMLRAYMHFLLVNLYGQPYTTLSDPNSVKGVPLKLDTDAESVLSRSSMEAVYNQILLDLNEAEKYISVERWDEGMNYQFKPVSLNAKRSRVFVEMGNSARALSESYECVNK